MSQGSVIEPYFQTSLVSLYKGDCLEVMPTLPDQSVDFILCDPPFQITQNVWDRLIPFEPLWAQMVRLIKPKGAIALFASQPFTSQLVMSNPQWFRYEWIWEKSHPTGHLDANKRPMKAHENILVFGGEKTVYYPQVQDKEPTNIRPLRKQPRKNGGCYGDTKAKAQHLIPADKTFPKSVLKYPIVPYGDRTHPNQKPLSILQFLIKSYSLEEQTILDFTMGSGSTCVAAQGIGRKSIGIELDSNYCEIAAKRCSQLSIFNELQEVIA